LKKRPIKLNGRWVYAKRAETKYIILHSLNSNSVSEPIEKGKAHYVVDKHGVITYVVGRNEAYNHCGMEWQKTKARWQGDNRIAEKSIGIEVAGVPGEGWGKPQYLAVKKLVHWLGKVYHIQAKNVLAHRQVAYSRFGRGRKGDPYGLDWAQLDLPDNGKLIDKDVVTGAIKPNFEGAKGIRDQMRSGDWRGNTDKDIQGLLASIALHNDPKVKAIDKAYDEQTVKELRDRLNKTCRIIPYHIQGGDSLIKIVAAYNDSADAGLTVQILKDYNGLDSDELAVGQIIKIPLPKPKNQPAQRRRRR
jgi:N-acetyl-anhydromuramyl-L-alanine amidase AmpD